MPRVRPDGEPVAVQITDLRKSFPPQPSWRHFFQAREHKVVLEGITLAVPKGEIFGLIGPNGAGKTTLIKILCGLILPTAGTARVAGFDVARQEQEVRRRIGLVYGDARSFFWRLSLRENLNFYSALYRMRSDRIRRRVDELAEIVGLTDALDTRMHFFSSGMKQRAAIARGLLTDPPIVFLDEPTATVDPVAAHDIRRLIRERVLQDGQRTVFLSTNVMSEAEELCDRVALLRQGHIEMLGGVDILREQFQPNEKYLLRIGATSMAPIQALRTLPGVEDVAYELDPSGLFNVTIEVLRGTRTVPQVIEQLVAASATVWECSPRKLSLDEMFRITFRETAHGAPAAVDPEVGLMKTA